MQLIKLTALSLLSFAFIITVTSCESDYEYQKVNEYRKTGLALTGAQEVPSNPSSALGTMDVFYSRLTKVLNYKVTWQGLTDTIVGIHIHGQAPVGFNAGIVQNILTTKNEAVFPFRGGTYSGTFNVDGVVVKEENLLNGFYYLNIHTQGRNPATGGTYSGGEIRGQIKFQ